MDDKLIIDYTDKLYTKLLEANKFEREKQLKKANKQIQLYKDDPKYHKAVMDMKNVFYGYYTYVDKLEESYYKSKNDFVKKNDPRGLYCMIATVEDLRNNYYSLKRFNFNK